MDPTLVTTQEPDLFTGALGVVLMLALVVLGIMQVVALWKVFTKAGKPGWASLVPFYNLYVMCQIAGKTGGFFGFFFIPLANIYAMFALPIALAKSFGRGTGFGLGLLFFGPIFYPILAFGQSRHSLPARSALAA